MATRRQRELRSFVGVDGEGGNINGRHEYLLLRAGDMVLETGAPLDHNDVVPFLANLSPAHEYVSYFFDYDVTMSLRSLPVNRIARLLDREGRTFSDDFPPWPVDVGPYQIDYLPHKELKVRREGRDWIIISDTGSFFQCSFIKALQRWGIGTDKTLALIGEGKEKRSDFGEMTEETRYYNGLEIDLLQTLMETFRQVCIDIGYVPHKWQGPGNLASAMLKKHGVPRSRDLPSPPIGVWMFAIAAYYGGRFETTAVGPVRSRVWQYDINSAYPWALTKLPCLIHGQWVHTSNPSGLFVARLQFQHPKDSMLCGFPVRRKDGSIHYPANGRGWYWSPEINAARRIGAKVNISDAWQYVPMCDCQPFDWIPDVYNERLRLGKTSKGMVLKLGTNSIYGKEAQSQGAAPYANPIYAGLITSITRAVLLNAVSPCPDACVMLATDGIFTTQPLNLPVSKQLGDWDLAVHDDGMFIIQPGLYFAGEQTPKTRGVPMGKVFERREAFEWAWDDSPWSRTQSNLPRSIDPPSVSIPLRNFISLRLAHARGKLETAGQWVDAPKEVSFDWSNKRRPHAVRRTNDGTLRTLPYNGAGDNPTMPYDKAIGGNLTRGLERLEWQDAPDWFEGLRPVE